jgi:hypothetical protein
MSGNDLIRRHQVLPGGQQGLPGVLAQKAMTTLLLAWLVAVPNATGCSSVVFSEPATLASSCGCRSERSKWVSRIVKFGAREDLAQLKVAAAYHQYLSVGQ